MMKKKSDITQIWKTADGWTFSTEDDAIKHAQELKNKKDNGV